MTIIDINDYLKKPPKTSADTYTITVTVMNKKPYTISYDVNPPNLANTIDGVRFIMYHLSEIAVDMCYGMDPSLIVQLQELLENDDD